MQKLAGLRSLKGFRSLSRYTSTAMKAANSQLSSDSGSNAYGSFANLKITAEKLVKEQASVKTDLEMAHTKLRSQREQINLLEGKLQQAVNENAKLKVEQTEDSKLWQGLDSKVSSIKTLCDQLTETLQQLASQTKRVEEDKKLFEEKLVKNSTALAEFNCMLHDLSTKLECAEQTIISGKQEMFQIKHEKEEMDQSYKARLCTNDMTIKENDSLIKQLEGSGDESKARLICLDSCLQCMEQELKLKDDVCISLKENLASAEGERNSLKLRNQGCSLETAKLCKNNKDLNDLLSSFVAKVTELDKENASMTSDVCRLLSSFERFQGMVQEEEMLIARSCKEKIEELQKHYVEFMSENNGLKIEIEELKSRIIELQKTQEVVIVQHVEECQVAEDKIRRLESEAEVSASNINRLEILASELRGRIQKLLEDSTVAENHQQELLEKISKLESDNQELVGKVQSITDEKSNNAESLQGEIAKRDQQVDTLESQVNQLHGILDEKEQLYSCSLEREKPSEAQKLQVEASLAATECQLIEAKKQYDLMLEGKQIELSKHLKELSLKNDQAINDILKEYELEMILITNAEKQKAEKLTREMESKCNEELSENKNSESYLMHLKEEPSAMVARIQQDNEHKESTLWAYHKEEPQRIQCQDEDELKKRLLLLITEQELQTKSLRIQHEEECQRLQQELELQKSKDVTLSQNISQMPITTMLNKVQTGYQDVPKHIKDLNTKRCFSTDAKAAKDWQKLRKMSIQGNTALVVLDGYNRVAFKRSYIRGIRKLIAWCRRNGIYKDLSEFFGPGAEVFTTPATGTFHFTFLFRRRERYEIQSRQRRLTFYLHGRDLYVRGWRTKKRLFEIQEKSKEPQARSNYFNAQDSEPTVLKIGFCYSRYVGADLGKVRIGPEVLMDSFDSLYKSNGRMSSEEYEALTCFCHHTAEPARIAEIEEAIVDSFDDYSLATLGAREGLPAQVRNYDINSEAYLRCVDYLIRREPIPEIIELDGVAKSFEELRAKVTVPLRDSYWSGEFAHESAWKPDFFCPPCPDSMREDEHWVQKLLEEDADDVQSDSVAP